MSKLLEVRDLEVSFDTYAGEVKAVRGVSFDLSKGEAIAIVGESGCGKSVTAQSIMRLIPSPPGRVKNGTIIFNDIDILSLNERQMQAVRGSEMGMIFQDPMTSLNPTMTVGRQIQEVLMKHSKITKKETVLKSAEMLQLVGIPNPIMRLKQYPHEYSGGMRQRAMIAMALACGPKLLIADEPTTALDVTIQAQILDLMRELQRKLDTAIILITHDLGVVADLAERVIVMYAGKIIEYGSVEDIYYNPKHPYTWGLLKSVPRLDSHNKEQLISIDGTPPDLFSPPNGCSFAARCDYAMKVCHHCEPGYFDINNGHKAACWLMHEYASGIESSILKGVI